MNFLRVINLNGKIQCLEAKIRFTRLRITELFVGGSMSEKKWVYLFNEVEQAEAYAGSWDGVRGLLGGKVPTWLR